MVIQKLTLAEWFLTYQLEKIKNKSFQVPLVLKVDITQLTDYFSKKEKKFPLNSLFLIALGIWAEENPDVNKMLFKNVFGYSFLKGDEIRINFPIQIEMGLKKVTSAIVIKDPQTKTWNQLQSEIKTKVKSRVESFPVTQFVYSKKNNFFNRWLLKSLHSFLMFSPRFYWSRGGGCISLSSLSQLATNPPTVYPLAFGPTGFTFCYSSIDQTLGQSFLQIGVGYDHNCFEGSEAVGFLRRFCEILEAKDQKHFERLTRSV